MIKRNLFSLILMTSFLGCMFLVFVLNAQGIIIGKGEDSFRYITQALFFCGVLCTAYLELEKPLNYKSFFSPKGMLLFSLALLLVCSYRVGLSEVVATIFIFFAIVYSVKKKRTYALNKVYLYVFLYALLRVFGTIGTPEGFRFPEKMVLFFLLPFAFSCFKLEKTTVMKILRFFFRVTLVYLSCSLLFWAQNALLLDIPVIGWLTSKATGITIEPSTYYWVSSWSGYEHPSYNSLLVIFALISGFYLFYKKEKQAIVTKTELFLFIVLATIFILLVQSRIGLVALFSVIVITSLYYVKLKTKRFKQALIFTFAMSLVSLSFAYDIVSGFVKDEERRENYILAGNYIKEHPFWGCGYFQQKDALEEQLEKMADVLPVKQRWESKTYVHNQLLGDMLQFGVFGAFFFFLLIYNISKFSVSNRSYPLQMFVITILIFMTIEEPLYVQAGITRTLLFLTLFIFLSDADKPSRGYHLFNKKKAEE